MSDPWPAVREAVAEHTDRVLSDLDDEWGPHRTIEPFTYGPRSHDPDEPPSSLEGQLEVIGGIASVLLFYTPERRETVLVYNPSGGWEPPGGVIEWGDTPEATARVEARDRDVRKRFPGRPHGFLRSIL